MDNLARCHMRGVFFFFFCTRTHAHEFAATPRQCLLNQNQGQREFSGAQTTDLLEQNYRHTLTHTPRHCYFHISARPQIFLQPLQSNIPDPIQPQRIVFILLTVFDIQSEIHGAEMAEMATSVHKQHQQKGYKIFMRLKTRMGSTV